MDVWLDTMLAGDGLYGCCTMDEALSLIFLVRNRVTVGVLVVCRFYRLFWYRRSSLLKN